MAEQAKQAAGPSFRDEEGNGGLTSRRAKARERKRRQRARQRAGVEVFRVEVDAAVADALVERGLLPSLVSDQPEAVSRAIRAHLIQSLGLARR